MPPMAANIKDYIMSSVPKSDENNHYIPFFSIGILSWASFLKRANMSLFHPEKIDNKATREDYEQVVDHVVIVTKRARAFLEILVYFWLIITFLPGCTIYRLERIDNWFAAYLTMLLKIYVVGIPPYIFYFIYGKKQSMMKRVQLALDELNDRKYNPQGLNWSIDPSGKFIRLQLNFSHVRDALKARSEKNYNKMIVDLKVPERLELEIPEIERSKEDDVLDLIRGKKQNLKQPLIQP